MSRWLSALLLCVVAAAGLRSASAQPRDTRLDSMRSERRLALVIGNSNYASSPLRNPVNDARAMTRLLRELGFEVMAHENVSQRQLRLAIIAFGDKLQAGGVGLFYFAGHGLQVAGRNYMVPTDAEMKSEREVEVESVDVASVLARMETAKNRLNIVILDACRDNPFGRSFRSASRGLASIDAPSGTMLAYATAPGRVAQDGEGANGLYTGELLKAMREPGLRLEDMFKRVRHAVREKTRGEQVPWEASSIEGDFIFRLGAGAVTAAVTPPPTPSRPPEPRIREEFVQEVGTLSVRAKLAGVEVWLDEKKLGETSVGRVLHVDNLQVGSYRVRGRKAGYRDWEQQVEVVANQRAETIIDIEPLRPEPPRGSSTVLYERDFKVHRDWLVFRGPYCESRYAPDGFVLKNVSQAGTCSFTTGYSAPDGVKIEIGLRIVAGSLDTGIGLYFGEGGGRGHMLLISSTWQAMRLSFYDGTTWLALLPEQREWVQVRGINTGLAAQNVLAVEIRGSTVRAYVNGRLVADTTSRYPTTGTVGVHLETPGQEVVYSHLRITELPR